jgi:hypothetical protein
MSNPYDGLTSSTHTSRRSKGADRSVEARIGKRIEPQSNGCWLWVAGKSGGYGTHAAARIVHRFVYETLVGPIPEGHVLHHECETKDCCNPAHLTPMLPGDHTSHHARLRREVHP